MSTSEIANVLVYLRRSTIKDVLDNVGIHLAAGEEMARGKLDLVNLFEKAVIDIGIECFVAKCNGALLRRMGDKLGVPPFRKCIVERIRCCTIESFLQQVDNCIQLFRILVRI
jgi:hypothetical protein